MKSLSHYPEWDSVHKEPVYLIIEWNEASRSESDREGQNQQRRTDSDLNLEFTVLAEGEATQNQRKERVAPDLKSKAECGNRQSMFFFVTHEMQKKQKNKKNKNKNRVVTDFTKR
jgi:hypothetical protein